VRSPPLQVDRDRYLVLVAALFAPGCAQPPAVVSAPGTIATVDVPPPVASSSPKDAPQPPAAQDPSSSGSPEVAATSACSQENETGAVDCSGIARLRLGGPACEGAAGTCGLLAQGYAYRPRAAQAAAECFERLGKRLCDIQARKRCFEQAVHASCPEPQFEATCADAIERCNAAHIRPRYTKQECMQALSSLQGGDRDWAAGAMGPSSEGKCELMFTVF